MIACNLKNHDGDDQQEIGHWLECHRMVKLEAFSAWKGYPLVGSIEYAGQRRATASGPVIGGSDFRDVQALECDEER